MSESKSSCVDVLIKIAGVFIAFFGVWQYFHQVSLSNDRSSQQRSVSFIKEFGTGRIASSRMSLAAFWLGHPEFVHHMNQHGASEDAIKQYFRYALETYKDKRVFIESVLQVTTFYDRLGYCVASMSCDYAIACDYFANRAEGFYSSHRFFLQEFKDARPYLDVGDGPERVICLCKQYQSM